MLQFTGLRSTQLIPLNAEDGKKVWEKLQKVLPTFALFRSDRPSRDEDPEVQDPMALAVKEAVREVEADLEQVRAKVHDRVAQVAQRTIEKLREMDPALASELKPEFRAEPKWEAFKLSLVGDGGIPINKRGSGVRRLILLNFFRAEAERRQAETESPGVIYAIEEPETSQHVNGGAKPGQRGGVKQGHWRHNGVRPVRPPIGGRTGLWRVPLMVSRTGSRLYPGRCARLQRRHLAPPSSTGVAGRWTAPGGSSRRSWSGYGHDGSGGRARRR